MNDEQPQQDNSAEPQFVSQASTPENKTTVSKAKSKKVLILIFVLVLLVGAGLAYALFGDKSTDKQTEEENQTQEEKGFYQGRWLYTNEQDKQVYIYNSGDNTSTPLIKLTEGEQVNVSPDGEILVRTRKNIVETAVSSENPDFKKIYEDSDQSSSLSATWLPDSSGFIVSAGKLTNPEDDNGDYWIPYYVYTVTKINADGSDIKKLFDYPVAYGGISIEGVDVDRDELYLSEAGEGGLRVPLGVYRLSDGAKIEHNEQPSDSGILPVANGKAYATQTTYDNNKIRAKIIEINLDNDEQKVIYESAEIEERTFQRDGNSFMEGISILNVKLSEDKTKLYFDEIHNLENIVTKLKVLDLVQGSVDSLYEPATEGNYITVETQTATSAGLIARVSCGGCPTAEYNKLGNEWVFIDPNSGKWQTIEKTSGDVYFSKFSEIHIYEPLPIDTYL